MYVWGYLMRQNRASETEIANPLKSCCTRYGITQRRIAICDLITFLLDVP